MKTDWKETPIFILTKDRKSCLEAMLERLKQDGLPNLFVVDTGSTYPPMVEFLQTLTVPIIRCIPKAEHAPKFALWDCNVIKEAGLGDHHFVYTDCDTVPDRDCPANWLEYLFALLARHKKFKKAGLGLKLADIPECYAHRAKVLKHEAQFYTKLVEPHVFSSEIDTTMALYRPGTPHTFSSLRTGGKYLARHLPWYYDSANLPEEERYYIANMHPKASMWTRKDRK